jgi:hypothetical protein
MKVNFFELSRIWPSKHDKERRSKLLEGREATERSGVDHPPALTI